MAWRAVPSSRWRIDRETGVAATTHLSIFSGDAGDCGLPLMLYVIIQFIGRFAAASMRAKNDTPVMRCGSLPEFQG
jgi:hypothetical protein